MNYWVQLIRKCIALLRSGVPIEQGRIDVWGQCYFDERIVINIDLSDEDKVRTLLHECIHWLHPRWPEVVVLSMEKHAFAYLEHMDKEFGIFLFFLDTSDILGG